MEGKAKRIKFSGEGLFSSINVFTTRLAMIDAIETYGLGGDSLRCSRKGNEEGRYKGFAPSSPLISGGNNYESNDLLLKTEERGTETSLPW